MKPGLISFTKAFVLATGLSLGSVAVAFAGAPAPAPATTLYSPTPLGPQATTPLWVLYVNPPMGAVTLGGIPFNTSNFALLRPGQSLTVPTSVQNATAAYLLLNSGNTGMWAAGQTEGRVRLSFSNGTFQDTPLVVGSNIREWMPGGGTVGWLTSTATLQVWTGSGAVIDMLTIPITPTTATLTGVTVSNLAPFGLNIQFNGLTISDPPATVAKGDGDEDEDDDDDDDAAPATDDMHHDAAGHERHDAAKAPEAKHEDKSAPKAKPADDHHDRADEDAAKKAETEHPERD